jgi:hypothetical protein
MLIFMSFVRILLRAEYHELFLSIIVYIWRDKKYNDIGLVPERYYSSEGESEAKTMKWLVMKFRLNPINGHTILRMLVVYVLSQGPSKFKTQEVLS